MILLKPPDYPNNLVLDPDPPTSDSPHSCGRSTGIGTKTAEQNFVAYRDQKVLLN